jgi:serine/threonine protein kinase
MGASTKSPNLVMVTEYLDGGSLFDIIHKRKKRFTVDQVLRMMKQVAYGVNYLHMNKPMIIHR